MNLLKDIPRESLLNLLIDLINNENNYKLIRDQAPTFRDFVIQQGFGSSRAGIKVIIEVKNFDIAQFELLNNEFNKTVSFYNQRNPDRYIVVIPDYLMDNVRQDYIDRCRNVLRREVEIWDAWKIDEIIEKYIDVYKKHVTTWSDVYSQLNELLYKFYQKYNDPIVAGKELYKECVADPLFEKSNPWISKFEAEYGIKSLDPFHVFFSINAGKISYENRLGRINLLSKILGGTVIYKDIIFAGCPTPVAAKILSSRKENQQAEIWEFYANTHEKKRKGFGTSEFKKLHRWNGIQLNSFTMFLFWIDSETFLPLDSNVTTFVVSNQIRGNIPKSYNTYISFLKNLDGFNDYYPENYKYGKNGIYRELTHVAYQFITEKKELVIYTTAIKELLREKKRRSISETTIVQVESPGIQRINRRRKQYEERMVGQQEEASRYASRFKVLAIRPLSSCDQNLLKVLKVNANKEEVYQFERTIEITDGKILYRPRTDINLYSEDGETPINVTAIVGKNGSGKSTLVELMFGILNNVSFSFKKKLNTSDLQLLNGLHAELFYISFGVLNKLVVKGSDIKIQKYNLIGQEFVKDGRLREFRHSDFDSFFYTVAVNYSIYGLNRMEMGDWIEGLFHKNDGYQTPLVINPMRNDGVININKENELLSSRLMANLLQPTPEEDLGFKQLTDKQKASVVELELTSGKYQYLYIDDSDHPVDYKVIVDSEEKILNKVKEVFEFDITHDDTSKPIIAAKKYIVRKLVRIAIKYFRKEKYFDQDQNKFDEEKLQDYITGLKDNPSHITDKLMQTINYLKYPKVWPKKGKFKIDLTAENQVFNNVISVEGIKVIELIPPPIFSYKIGLLDEFNSFSYMSQLSSGEKQMIHSTNSIIYHLRNLDSVVEGGGNVKYNYVHLCLDEIELYYHPEMQRRYLNELLNAIKRIDLPNINGINICLVTHSPYILSDIPVNYTLRMGDSNQAAESHNTFGANIHQLLHNDFFLENGFIGELSKEKIKNSNAFYTYHINLKEIDSLQEELERYKTGMAPSYLTSKQKALREENDYIVKDLKIDISINRKEFHESLIELVGENILKIKLSEMRDLAFEEKK